MNSDKPEDTKLLPGWSLKYYIHSKNEKTDMAEWRKHINGNEMSV